MKTTFPLLLLLLCSLAQTSFARADSKVTISGFVQIADGQNYSFIDGATHKSFKLRPATSTAQDSIDKLKSFDAINGSATLIDETLLLESVDFVGLQRLIGQWQSSDGTTVTFLDYTRVNIVLQGSSNQYRYAVSPRAGSTWNVYFSDQSSVVLGNLEVTGDTAHIDFYDPKNGNVSQSFQLNKVNP